MFQRASNLAVLPPLSRRAVLHGQYRALAQLASAPDVPHEDNKPFAVPLPDDCFKPHNFDPPPYSLETTKSQLKQLYRDMLTIRRLELTSDGLYKAKKIRGFCHLSTGQEAVAVGIEHAISKHDNVITAYRSHGFTYMRCGSVKAVLGELLGRKGGLSRGKGGSMHMFASGFFGGNGIVGASVPVGTGVAFAQQYCYHDDDGKNRNRSLNVTVNVYGDGAANQGQVYEAFNMAKLWNLPVLYACENNQYGMGTSAERASADTDFYKRGQFIPGLRVDGMDVLAVLAAVKHARRYIQEGNGPLVYEFITYRYAGHSMSDPGVAYRSREELKSQRGKDPLLNLKAKLLEWGVVSEEEVKSMDKEVRQCVSDETKEADEMAVPEASLGTLFEDVYVRGSEPGQRRGRTVHETVY